jgi:hypothetical protein
VGLRAKRQHSSLFREFREFERGSKELRDNPDRRRAERLRPLFQFIKVSMLKSNGQKTQEIEVRKKHSSN